jgi:AbrB family looped-hinge helix DNA binding protein
MRKITIGQRGVLTLPAKLRHSYGIKENDELIVEETAQGLLLRPCISMPIEFYSKDRPILATAIAANCERLITGDKKDFGHLYNQTINGITILTTLMFAQELLK